MLTLPELRRRHVEEGRPLPAALERELRADPRSAVRDLLAAVDRRRRANRAEGQRLRRMLDHENELWASGLTLVAGVDEAGMSPLAGPVAAAAVVLAPGTRIRWVDDSKKLDEQTREALAPEIRARAVAWCVAFVEPDEIEQLNIYHAGIAAMERAVAGLGCATQHLLIDARRLKRVELPQKSIIHGDALSLSIAAASILAKTSRDGRMRRYDGEFPGYGFARHKGYPVKEHYAALARLGPCPIHRRGFLTRAAMRQGRPRWGPPTAGELVSAGG